MLAHPANELFEPERLGVVARTKRLIQGLGQLRREIFDLVRGDQFCQRLERRAGEDLRLLARQAPTPRHCSDKLVVIHVGPSSRTEHDALPMGRVGKRHQCSHSEKTDGGLCRNVINAGSRASPVTAVSETAHGWWRP
jgi:hypothetical protein